MPASTLIPREITAFTTLSNLAHSYVVGPAVRLVRGASMTLEFRFTLPPGVRALRVEPSARVPAVPWRFRGDHWTDGEAHNVAW